MSTPDAPKPSSTAAARPRALNLAAACGTYHNAAEVIWTTDAKNVLGYIRASNADVPALYQWWRANG